jgi:3-methyl-2-oxobutanoate hydroxymethyltransferase
MMLVGDSLGMVVQGKEHTLSVTIEEMVYHCKAVARGRERALIVADMPYLSYHISVEETIRNAGALIRQGGADAVKLEGGKKRFDVVEALLNAEIPVMGHLGLTPQSIHQLGGFRVQGKNDADQERLKEEALALQRLGVFALVLECVPLTLAAEITDSLDIPTIGIGAGPYCSGQVLVFHDLLGMSYREPPRFVRRFETFSERAETALRNYCQEVRQQTFPSVEESYGRSRRNLRIVSQDG